MPSYKENYLSPYSTEKIFAIVADIKSYPEFLPWVAGARILESKENLLKAELLVRFNGFTSNYTSRVTLNRPETAGAPCSIEVELEEGPFKHLSNRWFFKPEDKKTEINFSIDFAFKSRILEKMIGGMFDKAVKKMVAAFEKRAEELYS